MKLRKNNLVLIVFALQLIMLLSVIALVYVVSSRGQTVTLEMTGYDPYDVLRGRYFHLRSVSTEVVLEPNSIERYGTAREKKPAVYVIFDMDPDSGISSFSYASLDRPDSSQPYIKCESKSRGIYDNAAHVIIYPRLSQYYLNEKHADLLDQSAHWDSQIQLSIKTWNGMYVIDGLLVDGQRY